ncbi:MAG: Fe-S cluster assembly protein SufD [Gammaproteobacteria bacterium]
MSAPAEATDHWLADYRRVEPDLPGGRLAWLQRLRIHALDAFAESGLPTTRQEAWKYTDVKPIARRTFAPAVVESRPDAAVLRREQALASGDAARLVFIDGRFAPEVSDAARLPEGATVASLASVLEQPQTILEPYLGSCMAEADQGFAALNTAFMRDGAYVHLSRGTVLEQPIELLYVSSGAPDRVAHLRNLIIAEEGAAAVVVENYVSLADGAHFTNAVTEVIAERNAQVEHYKLGHESDQAYHIGAIHVRQQRDSRFASHSVALGGRLVRNELHVNLEAEGCECALNGLYLTRGRQHVDNHTRIDHRAPHTTSRQFYKGVLDGRSRAVFSGRVMVHQDAQKTDAQQSNDNLLLSEHSEADSRPQLEIYADDVKCSHGTTVGQLDPDSLFYLRSRGVGLDRARSLLVYAFAADVLERMKLMPVREQLERVLTGQLLDGQSVRGLE